MTLLSFDASALEGILGRPSSQRAMAVFARPDILLAAITNCSTPFPGDPTRNPAPGTVNGATGVYLRSGEFSRTLELNISPTDELEFSSSAVSRRKGFAYGQALIDGRAPFIGPYRLLPPEYYT
jgi:hypothetical protein